MGILLRSLLIDDSIAAFGRGKGLQGGRSGCGLGACRHRAGTHAFPASPDREVDGLSRHHPARHRADQPYELGAQQKDDPTQVALDLFEPVLMIVFNRCP